MSSGPPRAVLSERLQECLASRRVRSAVFLTYCFDPGFFEQEILPTLFDKGFSHETGVRLIQLEDLIRSEVDHLAVYYDHGALQVGAQGAKLDVRRIPIRWPTGYFHPKVVLLLVDPPLGDDGVPTEEPPSLLFGVLSANLTEAGWWKNVEAAHFDELEAGEKTSLRDDLRALLKRVRGAAGDQADHSALDQIDKHLKGLEAHQQKTWRRIHHPRIWCGGSAENLASRGSLPEFFNSLTRRNQPFNLEIISPYLDEGESSGPLRELAEVLQPREIRVHLPIGPDGEPQIPRKVYEAIASVPETTWARLPKDLLQSGDAEQAAPRPVHAKVYRIFSTRPNYEAIFVGSVNLTQAGHSKGGNFEAGILIETESPRRLDWWLDADAKKPSRFPEAGESEDSRSGPGSRLALTYYWDREIGEALWHDDSPSPKLQLDAQGSPLFELRPLEPGQATPLSVDQAAALAAVLKSTSFVTVRIEGKDDATILVQEEGMAGKPSILLNLSVADILRYWAELNESQKAALLEEHYAKLVPSLSALMPQPPLGGLEKKSIFDTFAGFFHAFGTLEREVFRALEEGREKEAVYRILGKKHDSLPHLLDRVEIEARKELGAVERLVLLLCARQLLQRLRRENPQGFATDHRADLRELDGRIDRLTTEARNAVAPSLGKDSGLFFKWYEDWFLTRAEPIGEKPG